MAYRAILDPNEPLRALTRALEQACIETIESGTMTKDLAVAIHGITDPDRSTWVTTREFLDRISEELRRKMQV